jgi:hypothetical protein
MVLPERFTFSLLFMSCYFHFIQCDVYVVHWAVSPVVDIIGFGVNCQRTSGSYQPRHRFSHGRVGGSIRPFATALDAGEDVCSPDGSM